MWFDSISHASPLQLRFDGTAWVLELEELMRVFGPVYRPVKHRLLGTRNILDKLNRNPDTRGLAKAASVLFAAQPEEAVRESELARYGSYDGTWHEMPRTGDLQRSARPRRWGDSPSGARVPRRLRTQHARALLELRAELRAGLRAEPRADLRADKADRVPGMAPLPSQEEPLDEVSDFRDPPRIRPGLDSEPPPPPRESVAIKEPEIKSGAPIEGEQESSDVPAGIEPAADEPAADEPEAPILRMPKTVALQENIEMLLGVELDMKDERGEHVELTETQFSGAHASLIIDDEDQVVGALVADSRATIGLGCGLLGTPNEERDRQLSEGQPSEEVLESTAEVFNTLSATLNMVSGNVHVRVKPIAPVDVEAEPWLSAARERVRLDLGEYGVLLLLGR